MAIAAWTQQRSSLISFFALPAPVTATAAMLEELI
jgi:hypothetical protein